MLLFWLFALESEDFPRARGPNWTENAIEFLGLRRKFPSLSDLSSGAVWLPFLAAVLHPPMAWLFQKGERMGVQMPITVGISNLSVGLIFLLYFGPSWSGDWSGGDLLAVGTGVFFFAGQWFSVRAAKKGDLVVHLSALGTKLLLVAALSVAIGLEQGGLSLVGAVLLAAVGIFYLSGGDLAGWAQHRATLGWTVVGTVFFGLSDVSTSLHASALGASRWLLLMMLGSSICSLLVLASRRMDLVAYVRDPKVVQILFLLGLLMGVQAILINTAFSVYREPTVSNVVFSLRGLLAVPFLMLVRRRWRGVVSGKTLFGAGLMMAALILAVV